MMAFFVAAELAGAVWAGRFLDRMGVGPGICTDGADGDRAAAYPCRALGRLAQSGPAQQLPSAAGACHILAWAFCEMYPNAGFSIVAIRQLGEQHACHVYASDGTWAFDHAGWTLEDELLRKTKAYEGYRVERLLIRGDLATFCLQHHSRPPELYWSDPWPRARRYLARFAAPRT